MFVYGSVALALAMAKEKGIVAVLCQAEDPLFSSDIAAQAKLKERYLVILAFTCACICMS